MGVTRIETRAGGVTLKTVEPVMGPEVALTVDEPAETPVVSPAAVTVATLVIEEDHVTELVRLAFVPLL
jgi:hypothetical protein